MQGARGAKLKPKLGCRVGLTKFGGCVFVVKISFNQGMDKTQRKYLGVSSPCASRQARKKEYVSERLENSAGIILDAAGWTVSPI